jgi:hypothetical protein
LTLTVVDVVDDEVLRPLAGDSDNQLDPPEVVEADAVQLMAPPDPLSTEIDLDAGAAPPATAWNRSPLWDRLSSDWLPLTVAVTSTSKVPPVGAKEIEITPTYVPAIKPTGLAVIASDVGLKGPAVPPAGETLSQLTEEVALKVRGVLDRLFMAMLCEAGVLAPWTKLNVSPPGSTVTGPSPVADPVTLSPVGIGKSKGNTWP